MATAPTGHLTLHDRLASAVRNPGGYSVGANIETSGIEYTCVMATDLGRQTAIQIYDDDLEDFVDLEPGTSVHNKSKIKLTRRLVLQADIYDDELEDFVDLEPGTSEHNKTKIKLTGRFITALQQLLRGDPARMPEDCLGELRFAFACVPEPFGAVAVPRSSNPWDHAGITSMIPFQTDRREEWRQPAARKLAAQCKWIIPKLGKPQLHLRRTTLRAFCVGKLLEYALLSRMQDYME
ncbi:hypothetical protein MTO96_040478 [Rhipicephalus appendiculatus]